MRFGVRPKMFYQFLGKITRKRLDPRNLFDSAFYKYTYEDVATAQADPFEHFMSCGWREGRKPSARFDTIFYIDRYLGEEDVNPLAHYASTGHRRGHITVPSGEEALAQQKRRIAPHFDADFYVSSSGMELSGLTEEELVDHYLMVGWRKGFEPHRSFSSSYYLGVHPHARTLDVSPFYHYLVTRERLRASVTASTPVEPMETAGLSADDFEAETILADLIDESYYLSTYPDVARAGYQAVEHYVHRGWKEGRNPSRLFWTSYYRDRYRAEIGPDENPLLHYFRVGQPRGYKPNPGGDRLLPAVVRPSAAEWDALPELRSAEPPEVSVIMPVYRGRDDTLAAIYAVLEAPQATAFELIVVNDRSPDPDLTDDLRRLSQGRRFRYVENEVNLGFVGTINKALRMTALDVVLLNSDAVVYGDWIDRLVAHAQSDPTIATITPLSNNATICSYPAINQNNMFELETSFAEIDRFASLCNGGMSSDVPTGVGFCFLITRKALDAVGTLDEAAFGKGYGEENDFCMRARKVGFTNKLALDTFVRHTGQVSFTATGITQFDAGQAALSRKHPDYGMSVFRYVNADIAKEARFRLDAFRLFQHLGPRIALVVTHSLIGGILTHVGDMTKRLESEGMNVVYFKTGSPYHEFFELVPSESTDIHLPNLYPLPVEKHEDLIVELLAWMRPEFIHVHSLATLSWPAANCLVEVIEASGFDYVMTMHDYSSFCHRNNLVLVDATFCDMPSAEVCRACARTDHRATIVVDPDIRKSVYARFMKGAQRVFVPSRDTARRLRSVFVDQAFEVRPHAEEMPRTSWPSAPPASRPLIVATLGAIGPSKGSGLLHALALDARARELPIAYHVVGYSDIPGMLSDVGVVQTGAYADEAEALALIETLEPHLCFMSSIWPETYSYALSLMLTAGIPVVTFDIGAQAERLADAGDGIFLSLDLLNDPASINDRLLALDLEAAWSRRRPPHFAEYPSILSDYYGRDRSNSGSEIHIANLGRT